MKKTNIFSLLFVAGISCSVIPSGFCSELMDEVIAKSRSRPLVKSENAQTINGLRIGHYIRQNTAADTQDTNNGQRRIEQLGEWKDYIMCMSSVFLPLDILFDPKTEDCSIKKDVFITEFKNVLTMLQPISECVKNLSNNKDFSAIATKLNGMLGEINELSEGLLKSLNVTLKWWALLKPYQLRMPDDWDRLSPEQMSKWTEVQQINYRRQKQWLIGKREISRRLGDLERKIESISTACKTGAIPNDETRDMALLMQNPELLRAMWDKATTQVNKISDENLKSIQKLCDDASFKLSQLADLSSEIEVMDEIVNLKAFFDKNFSAEIECIFCGERVNANLKNYENLPRWKKQVYNPCRNDEELRALGPMTAFYVLASRLNPNLVFYLSVGENEVFSLGNWAVRVARATNNMDEMKFQTNLAANLIAAGLKYETIALRQAGLLSLVFDSTWRGRLSSCRTAEQAQKLLEACQKKIRLEAFDFLRSDNDIKIIVKALAAMYALPEIEKSQGETVTQAPATEKQKPEIEIEEEEEVED